MVAYLLRWSERTVSGRRQVSNLEVGPWIFVVGEDSMADERLYCATHIWP